MTNITTRQVKIDSASPYVDPGPIGAVREKGAHSQKGFNLISSQETNIICDNHRQTQTAPETTP